MRKILLYTVLLFIISCAPTRFQKPLEKGKTAIGLNAGGPLVKLGGATIPVPFSSVYAGFGLQDNLSLITGLHTTSLLFGNAQLDASLLTNLYTHEKKNFQVSGEAGVMNILDMNNNQAYRIYPKFTVTGSYEWKRNYLQRLYTGLEQWIDLYSQVGVLPEQHNYWLPAIHIGYAHEGDRWNWGLEGKYSGFLLENEDVVVNYQTPFNTGNIGIYLFIHKKF